MDFNKIEEYLKENLNEFRYNHTLRVVGMGLILAEKYNYIDVDKVKIACYLHDSGKNLSSEEILKITIDEGFILSDEDKENIHVYHGVASMVIARDVFNISDVEVLDAIKNHVMGSNNMTMLDKIVFLADFFEFGRKFEVVHKSRDAALIDLDLDKSMILAYDAIISDLINRRCIIHENTLKSRNFILRNYLKGIS